MAVHDTISVIAPTLADVPSCGRGLRLEGTGRPTGIEQTVTMVGNLDFSEQRSDVYADDSSFYDNYHVYNSMRKRWRAMANRSSDVTLEAIGQSLQGVDIEMLRIGRTNAEAPKRVFINALQHAREWASTMTVTYIADQLTDSTIGAPGVEGNFTDEMAEVQKMLQEIEVLIVPIVNPDGYNYTRKSRFHRKNMRKIEGSTCTGVDLNRNWAKDYNGSHSVSSSVCSDVFVGEGPFSEPESATLRDALLGTENVLVHIDYHAFGGLILGPWGSSPGEKPPRAEEWIEFSSFVKKGMAEVQGANYLSGLGTKPILYPASGVMSDWSYDQGITSATIEVHPLMEADADISPATAAEGFLLDIPGLRKSCQDNFGGFTGILRFAFQKDGGAKTKLSPVIYALIATGILLAIIVIVILAWVIWRRRKQSPEK